MMYTSEWAVFRECRKLEEAREINEWKKKKGDEKICFPYPLLVKSVSWRIPVSFIESEQTPVTFMLT